MRLRQGYDVVVVGGGTAGAIAGIAAARTGARTLLVEQYGSLGGVLALGMSMKGVHDGAGRAALGGIGQELIERARAMEGATAVSAHPRHGSVMGQDPEALKLCLMEMVRTSGLQVLLHSFLVDALADTGHVQAVRLANKAGLEIVPARCFVDCTGDADLAATAGARFVFGREGDAKVQPVSAIFRVGGVELERTWAYLEAHPEDFETPPGYIGDEYSVAAFRSKPGVGVAGFRGLIRKARAAGDYTIPREDMGFNPLPGRREVTINITRVHGIDATDPDELTRAEIEGQRQILEGVRFLRQYVPGFEHCYVVSSPFQIGVRETRRIQGAYVLTREDVLAGRDFPDQVARGAYPLDIHDVGQGGAAAAGQVAGGGTDLSRLERSYGIPARCLVAQGVDNLLAAGRALSATHEAAGSARGQPVCMATGHAAGVMAALAALHSVAPARLDVAALQAELRRQGAVLERN
ncbi:FAD-dependent oxidoreductase [uncultured Azohydromonas sp.]|uniref:FAD-dependent oxidoreductase n=1 Tax=uncultured Azohydromonas sp. TaxID=487342 RepID=UPI00260632EE|nr:FAD-dependent oxidoreductase [uncultured Azohydromonas sp.]